MSCRRPRAHLLMTAESLQYGAARDGQYTWSGSSKSSPISSRYERYRVHPRDGRGHGGRCAKGKKKQTQPPTRISTSPPSNSSRRPSNEAIQRPTRPNPTKPPQQAAFFPLPHVFFFLPRHCEIPSLHAHARLGFQENPRSYISTKSLFPISIIPEEPRSLEFVGNPDEEAYAALRTPPVFRAPRKKKRGSHTRQQPTSQKGAPKKRNISTHGMGRACGES